MKAKISGPLLDRIDIHCEIQAVPFSELSKMQPGEPSAAIPQINNVKTTGECLFYNKIIIIFA